MSDQLRIEDLNEEISSEIYTQDYSKKPLIDGIKIVEIKKFTSEDGDFSEVLRIDESGKLESFPEFKITQINYSKMLGNVLKAWHLHLRQDEIWYVPSGRILLGLWDLRKNSATNDLKMRVILNNSNKLVFIPKGIAHGCANFSTKPANVIYFVNQQFNASDPDEKRIRWDLAGSDFWKPQRD